jgi:hypothetical protein
MNSFSRQSIKVNRKCSNKSFSFTGSHFSYLSLVKYNSSDQLYIIMNHIPSDHISTGNPAGVVPGFIPVYCDICFHGCKITVHLVAVTSTYSFSTNLLAVSFITAKASGKDLVQNFLSQFITLLFKLIKVSVKFFFFFYFDFIGVKQYLRSSISFSFAEI